ncbi:MAG TPA: BTAD domain-containing putative transcriptional regulator [Candidatus Elarobacter sp.]|nr:BTAD domain-containing putative transcriptional regulator [Candidatus Elarobacter sp.]
MPARPAFSGVERRRALAWFEAAGDADVRILCGPIGSGKTYAARQFVARNEGRAAYVRLPARIDAERLRMMIAASPATETVVLDDADRLDAAVYAELLDAIMAGELERKLVLIGRSRRRLRAESLLARGFARACNDEVLAFDAEELRALAAAHAVPFEDEDVVQLLHDTDGWPLASEWLIRDAAEHRRTLREAFAHWRARNGHLLLEFVEREGFEDAAAYEAFFTALRKGSLAADNDGARLEQLGLPIVRTRNGLRPYRILARLAAPASSSVDMRMTTSLPPLMAVHLFGRFRCEIGGQPVPFSRRRDQQVFAFVALQAECRTTRERLLEAFWREIPHTVASQGLRTTLSRIRRAISQTVPGVDPERYFETAGEVRVNVRTVAVDVHRFVDRVEQGRIEDARGALDGAKHHYRVAQKLYADRVLAAEAPEPCLERRAEHFAALYVEVLTRITELHAATGDLDTAREAARSLLACNTDEARRRALTCIAAPVAVAVATA